MSSGVPESVREGGRRPNSAQIGCLLLGVTMLMVAGALFYFATEPTVAERFSRPEVDWIAAAIAALAMAIILAKLTSALRMFGSKAPTSSPGSAFQGGERIPGAKRIVHGFLPYKDDDVLLELFEPRPGERQTEISLIDAVRHAYKESQTSAGASFATAFGNGPDDIVTMYATFFAENVSIYGCKGASAAVEQIFLSAPLKEFQIEDGALFLKERQGPAIYADLRIKTSDYPIVLARLRSTS